MYKFHKSIFTSYIDRVVTRRSKNKTHPPSDSLNISYRGAESRANRYHVINGVMNIGDHFVERHFNRA